MNKIFLVLLIAIFNTFCYSQHLRQVLLPSDEEQITMVINSITQGIKQQQLELILAYFDEWLKDFDDQDLDKVEQKIRIERFFSLSEMRKKDKDWDKLTPSKNLPSNWDYETENLNITFNGNNAIVRFKIFWLTNIKFSTDSTKEDLNQPLKKMNEEWVLRKVDNQWKVTKINHLFKFMKLVGLEK